MDKKELKKIADDLLYKDLSEIYSTKGLITIDFKKGYNLAIMDLADEIAKRLSE